MHPYPVTFEADYRYDRNRLTAFLRALLVIPWLVVSELCLVLAVLLAPVNWLVVIALGRCPDSLYRLLGGLIRFRVRTGSFGSLITDDWPPFRFRDVPEYPVRLRFAPPAARQSRLRALLRPVLAIPLIVLALPVGALVNALQLIAWLTVVFRGYLPAGIHNALAWAYSWKARVATYLCLMRDEYPPVGDEIPVTVGPPSDPPPVLSGPEPAGPPAGADPAPGLDSPPDYGNPVPDYGDQALGLAGQPELGGIPAAPDAPGVPDAPVSPEASGPVPEPPSAPREPDLAALQEVSLPAVSAAPEPSRQTARPKSPKPAPPARNRLEEAAVRGHAVLRELPVRPGRAANRPVPVPAPAPKPIVIPEVLRPLISMPDGAVAEPPRDEEPAEEPGQKPAATATDRPVDPPMAPLYPAADLEDRRGLGSVGA